MSVQTSEQRLREKRAKRLRSAIKAAGFSNSSAFAQSAKMNKHTVRSAVNGTRVLTESTARKFSKVLHISAGWLLFGEGEQMLPHVNADKTAAALPPARAKLRARGLFQTELEPTPIKGSVRPGFWASSYVLPVIQWVAMHLPRDPRYPGVPRHCFAQEGEAMNKVCRAGGTWVVVLYSDMPGQDKPSDGQYVMVERERKTKPDGGGSVEIEASVRRYVVKPNGKAWLYCDSTEKGFDPVPAEVDLKHAPDITRVRCVGRAVDVLNPLP